MTIIHINVPYSMLLQRIDFAIKNRIHPEIYFSAEDLDTCHEKDVQHLSEDSPRKPIGNYPPRSIHGFKSWRGGSKDQRGDL